MVAKVVAMVLLLLVLKMDVMAAVLVLVVVPVLVILALTESRLRMEKTALVPKFGKRSILENCRECGMNYPAIFLSELNLPF
jgi:hypothetical protein